MAELLTRADSIRAYLTGAASDGGAQTDPNLSLGNYRSSTEATAISHSVTNPISNVTIDFISGTNGAGSGTLTALTADTLAWTPPGDTQGAAVSIANGESKILEGGTNKAKYVRVSRTSATALSGTAVVATTIAYNNVAGFDNVSSDEATAGDDEYRAIMLKAVSAATVKNLQVFVGTLGTQQVSASAYLTASGAGSITLSSGTFSDWPASGFCRIESAAGSLKEIVYYSSRTNLTLTVTSGGRAKLGTSAQAGSATDKIYPVPGIRLAYEAPTSSHIQTLADESSAPTGVSWSTGITAATGLQIGDLASGAMMGIFIHRNIPAGAAAEASLVNRISWRFDAP